jgi:8-oxo-dGTP diphosphatase
MMRCRAGKKSPAGASPRKSWLARRESVRHKFAMTDSAKGHAPILAAGGIVLRGNSRPRIAVVRLRREKAWVLPKGKLDPGEHPRDAARREVLEETGYTVTVHRFLGSMSYAVEGKIKIVQFWLMRAVGLPSRDLMDDVKAVKWLPLRKAIDTLSRPHEKVFLTHVGPIALAAVKKSEREKSRAPGRSFVKAVGNFIDRMAQASVRRAG